MFQRLLAWIREVINKMIGQTTVKQALRVDVAVSSDMAAALQTWSRMYANQSEWLSADVKSLNLAAAIAGEIARSATIEMQVLLAGSPRADYLTAQLTPVLGRLREQIEKGCAKGGLVMKPYIDGKNIAVDFVQADQFYPVAFDSSGGMTACVFADQRRIGDYWYTRLEYHRMTPEGCAVTNRAFKSMTQDTLGSEISLAVVDAWADIQPEALIQGVDRPLYAYFKYPLANNIDAGSPLGVSCYSRAVDQIEQADRIWSNLLWEFESGKRAIYADVTAFDRTADGKAVLPDKRLYRTINATGDIGESELFKEWSPEFREAAIRSGLDAVLKKIEFLCGLAYGTLSDPATVEKTATEIAAARQRSAATIVDTQKALQAALDQLIWAMDVWATLAGLAPRGSYQAAYDFDDSLVVDAEAQMAQDRQTVGMGAMPKVVFLMRNYGLDEATAKKWIADVTAETPMDLFQGAQ